MAANFSNDHHPTQRGYSVRNRALVARIQAVVMVGTAVLLSCFFSAGEMKEEGKELMNVPSLSIPSLMPIIGASAVTMDEFVDTFPGLRTMMTGNNKKPRRNNNEKHKRTTSSNHRSMAAQDEPTTIVLVTEESSSSSQTLLLVVLDLILIGFAALFAGLTLAVMGLDTLSLEILSSSGREPDKTYATNILPVRRLGNQLLCTLLFGNVMVITGVSQVTAEFLSGWQATLVSTVLICLGGEIIPQASMSAHALAVGSRSTWIVKFFVFLFYPLCKPLGMFLDVVVGSDPGQIYERNELKDLMLKHVAHSSESGLEKSDLDLMVGVMELREKTVLSAMTPLAEVFMLEAHEHITEDLLAIISEKGHSRIPVYQGSRNNVVGVLHAKDLLLSDPEDNTKVITLVSFYQRKFHVVPSESKLISILRHFQTGRTHISLVQEVRFRMSMPNGGNGEGGGGQSSKGGSSPATTTTAAEGNFTEAGNGEGEGDPYYEVLGIITLEDVVEELLHAEIFDEHDIQAFRRSAEEYGSAESLYGNLLWQEGGVGVDGVSPGSSPMGGDHANLLSATTSPANGGSGGSAITISRNLTKEAAYHASISLRLFHTFHRSHRRIHLSLNQLAATAYFLQRNIPELAGCSSQQLLKALTKGGTGRLEDSASNSNNSTGEQRILGGPFCSVLRVKVPKDAAGFEWPSYKRVSIRSTTGDTTTTATVLDNNHNALLYVAGSPLHATLPPKEAVRYCAFRLQHERRTPSHTTSIAMSGPQPPSTIQLSGCLTLVISGRVQAASRGERAATHHPLPTNTTHPNTTNSIELVTNGSGIGNNTGLVAELPSWSMIGVDSMRNGVTVSAKTNDGVITDSNTVEYTCRVVQDSLLLQITTSQFLGLKNYLNL